MVELYRISSLCYEARKDYENLDVGRGRRRRRRRRRRQYRTDDYFEKETETGGETTTETEGTTTTAETSLDEEGRPRRRRKVRRRRRRTVGIEPTSTADETSGSEGFVDAASHFEQPKSILKQDDVYRPYEPGGSDYASAPKTEQYDVIPHKGLQDAKSSNLPFGVGQWPYPNWPNLASQVRTQPSSKEFSAFQKLLTEDALRHQKILLSPGVNKEQDSSEQSVSNEKESEESSEAYFETELKKSISSEKSVAKTISHEQNLGDQARTSLRGSFARDRALLDQIISENENQQLGHGPNIRSKKYDLRRDQDVIDRSRRSSYQEESFEQRKPSLLSSIRNLISRKKLPAKFHGASSVTDAQPYASKDVEAGRRVSEPADKTRARVRGSSVVSSSLPSSHGGLSKNLKSAPVFSPLQHNKEAELKKIAQDYDLLKESIANSILSKLLSRKKDDVDPKHLQKIETASKISESDATPQTELSKIGHKDFWSKPFKTTDSALDYTYAKPKLFYPADPKSTLVDSAGPSSKLQYLDTDSTSAGSKLLDAAAVRSKLLDSTDPRLTQLNTADPRLKVLDSDDPRLKMLKTADPNQLKLFGATDPTSKQMHYTDARMQFPGSTDSKSKHISSADPRFKVVGGTDTMPERVDSIDPRLLLLDLADPRLKQLGFTDPQEKVFDSADPRLQAVDAMQRALESKILAQPQAPPEQKPSVWEKLKFWGRNLPTTSRFYDTDVPTSAQVPTSKLPDLLDASKFQSRPLDSNIPRRQPLDLDDPRFRSYDTNDPRDVFERTATPWDTSDARWRQFEPRDRGPAPWDTSDFRPGQFDVREGTSKPWHPGSVRPERWRFDQARPRPWESTFSPPKPRDDTALSSWPWPPDTYHRSPWDYESRSRPYGGGPPFRADVMKPDHRGSFGGEKSRKWDEPHTSSREPPDSSKWDEKYITSGKIKDSPGSRKHHAGGYQKIKSWWARSKTGGPPVKVVRKTRYYAPEEYEEKKKRVRALKKQKFQLQL